MSTQLHCEGSTQSSRLCRQCLTTRDLPNIDPVYPQHLLATSLSVTFIGGLPLVSALDIAAFG